LSIAKAIPSRSDLTNLTAEIWPAVCELAFPMELATILAGQQHLKDSENQLKGNTQPRLWLEITLLGLLSPVRTNNTADLPSQPPAFLANNLSQNSGSGVIDPLASAQPQTTASLPMTAVPVSETVLTPPEPEIIEPAAPAIDLEHTWQQVLGQLLPSGKGLFAPHGQLLSIEGDVATVGMKSSTFMKIAEGQKQHLQKALTDLLDRPITVVLKLADADLASKNKSAQTKVVPSAASIPTSPAPTHQNSAPFVSPPAASSAPAIILAVDEILDEPDEYSAPDEVEIIVPLTTTSSSPSIVQEQPADFRSPVPEIIAPIADSHGNGHNNSLPEPPAFQGTPENTGEVAMASFTDLDLDAAAARLAEQFGGEIVEEYVTIWNL
jgi:DNA polymerase III gamma/tau subunit